MMPMVRIISFSYKKVTGKNRVGESKRGRKRERKKWIENVGG
jgi:hypothetical protein